MPRLSVWIVRAALTHLALGFTIGALMLANKALPFAPRLWQLLPVHMELLLVGWTVQLALGIGYWILPRLPEKGRGQPVPAWAAFVALNSGVLAVCASQWTSDPAVLMLVGRIVEAVAIVIFVGLLWPRVRAFELNI